MNREGLCVVSGDAKLKQAIYRMKSRIVETEESSDVGDNNNRGQKVREIGSKN